MQALVLRFAVENQVIRGMGGELPRSIHASRHGLVPLRTVTSVIIPAHWRSCVARLAFVGKYFHIGGLGIRDIVLRRERQKSKQAGRVTGQDLRLGTAVQASSSLEYGRIRSRSLCRGLPSRDNMHRLWIKNRVRRKSHRETERVAL